MPIDSYRVIREGLLRARWSVTDLWVASIGIGGAFVQTDVQHIADGRRAPNQVEHDILASALNDHFTGRGEGHPVLYWRDLAGT
jgi:hypothetical protein